MSSRSKRGAPDGIRRRDFLNGMLLAAGGAAVRSFAPINAFADTTCPTSPPPINGDARALRGGNLPSAFGPGHWMRDRRLSFTPGVSPTSVTVAPGPSDGTAGTFPIEDDPASYDVVIVGGGISALAAAFYLSRRRPGTRILILDANPLPGGNASRDDASPLPTISGTGGAYAVTPYADFLNEIYGTIGIDWTRYYVQAPFYNYYFDSQTPGVLPGRRGWNIDTFGKGVRDIPYAPHVVQDIQKSYQDFRNYYVRHGSPTDPADNADPTFDYLAQMTLADYLTKERGYDPLVADFYTRYSIDALAGTSEQVNAFNSISFLGAEFNPIFAFPGGTSGIARLLVKYLIPGAIGSTSVDDIVNRAPLYPDQLDVPGNQVRIRQAAVGVHADNTSDGANAVYWSWKDQKFYRASGRAVIIATQSHSARHIVQHLTSQAVKDAWAQFIMVPVPVAAVAIRSAAPLVRLNLGYDQYWWGSTYWADFVTADWDTLQRNDPNRPTVLTVFGGNTRPPEEMVSERIKLISTPFCNYEDSLRDDLNRVLADGGFDYDRDVTAVYLYRWGHGMIYPTLGFPFGPPQNKGGRTIRTPAPRHTARQQIGRISFAGQDTESSPALESAIGSGLRTANEVLAIL